MKKPEKCFGKVGTYDRPSEVKAFYNGKVHGRDDCCDEWEAFLPTVEEVRALIKHVTRENWKEDYTLAAMAIHKRLMEGK